MPSPRRGRRNKKRLRGAEALRAMWNQTDRHSPAAEAAMLILVFLMMALGLFALQAVNSATATAMSRTARN